MIGILNLHKPVGLTSRDCVNRIQRLVRPVKVGHAGTLDPLATGVLLILLGPATRLVDTLHGLSKTYRGTFQLGLTSPSLDTESTCEPIATAPVPMIADIEQVIFGFIGTIEQTPPVYSAVKLGGKPAYRAARRGQQVTIPPRRVVIHQLRLVNFDYPFMTLDIECSSGTYIRTLGDDIAVALGTRAVMTGLTRTAIGPFSIQTAVQLESCSTLADLKDNLLPISLAVQHLPRANVTSDEATRLIQGQWLTLPSIGQPSEVNLKQPSDDNLRQPLDDNLRQPSDENLRQPLDDRLYHASDVNLMAAFNPSHELVALIERTQDGKWKTRTNLTVS